MNAWPSSTEHYVAQPHNEAKKEPNIQTSFRKQPSHASALSQYFAIMCMRFVDIMIFLWPWVLFPHLGTETKRV